MRAGSRAAPEFLRGSTQGRDVSGRGAVRGCTRELDLKCWWHKKHIVYPYRICYRRIKKKSNKQKHFPENKFGKIEKNQT